MKRAICLIGILLLTALALAACGENEEYPYTLTVKNGCLRVTEGGEDIIFFDLSEMEASYASSPNAEDTMHCYDAERIAECLKCYFPKKISMREKANGEQPDYGGELYRVSLDFNDGMRCTFYIQLDGTVYFSVYSESARAFLVSCVSKPKAIKENATESICQALLSEKVPFECQCESTPSVCTDYEYRIEWTADGELIFGHQDETRYSLDVYQTENVYLYGRGIDIRLVEAPEKYQILPLLLPKSLWLRSLSEVAEAELYAQGRLLDRTLVQFDMNDNVLAIFYILQDGSILWVDPNNHKYISAPGACDVQEIIGDLDEIG